MKFIQFAAGITVSAVAVVSFVGLVNLAAVLVEAKCAPWFFVTYIVAILALTIKYTTKP